MWRVAAIVMLAGGLGWTAEPVDRAVKLAMQRAESGLTHFVVVARSAVTDELDVAVALGSPRAIAVDERFVWSEADSIGLYLQERSRPSRVYLLGSLRGFPDCLARVERVTATDAVISCRGEKAARYAHQKWVYDVRAKGLVGQLSYEPVPLLGVVAAGAGVKFAGSGLGVEYRDGVFRVVTTKDTPKAEAPNGIPALERTSYAQFAAARPQRVKDGYRAAGTVLEDAIGPWVREGKRTWFGKTFYDGEGHTGVGGFGFHDAETGERKMFTPPELLDWSVSALAVEPEAVWMGLVRRGEWGDGGGGLLRYDRAADTVRRTPLTDLASGMMSADGRLFVATDFGVALVERDTVRRYFVDRTLAGRWRVVEAVR